MKREKLGRDRAFRLPGWRGRGLMSMAGLALLVAAYFSIAGTPTASAGSSKCAHKGSTIVIGAVGTYSGQLASVELSARQAVQAWVKMENQTQGGINCHPIDYITIDDHDDPAQNLTAVHQLVQQDHVVAFVGMTGTDTLSASESYLASTHIPVIAGNPPWEFYYSHPNFFPPFSLGTVPQPSLFDAMALIGKPKHLTKIGMFDCSGVAICSDNYSAAPAWVKGAHLKLGYLGAVPLTASDFTANCTAAKSSNTPMMTLFTIGAADVEFADQCASLGYHPLYGIIDPLVIPSMLTDPNLNGMVETSATAPFFDTAVGGVVAFRSTIAKYGSGEKPDSIGMLGWTAAMLFQAATASLPASGKVTAAEILKGLDSIKDNDLGGITGPLTFRAGHDAPMQNCFWILRQENGKVVLADKGLRTCAS